MVKAFVGIDPGQTGAIAVLSDDLPLVYDYPGDVTAAANLISDILWDYTPSLVALERVHSMPKQGVSSTFKLGVNFGAWQGILSAYDMPYIMPTPQEWQKGLVYKSDGNDPKSRSLAVARRLFPDVDLSKKKHDGRADALLIAYYAKQKGSI